MNAEKVQNDAINFTSDKAHTLAHSPLAFGSAEMTLSDVRKLAEHGKGQHDANLGELKLFSDSSSSTSRKSGESSDGKDNAEKKEPPKFMGCDEVKGSFEVKQGKGSFTITGKGCDVSDSDDDDKVGDEDDK